MPDKAQSTPRVDNAATATIPNGTAITAGIDLFGTTLLGIQFPSAFTGTSITFQVSADGSTYVNMLKSDASTEYSVAVTASRYVPLPQQDFLGVRFLKIRSGTGGSPTNEGADRTLLLAVRPVF